MRYEGVIYRPPSEANSLLIQATIGCPHNLCTFCAIYKKTKFRVRPVEEIKEDLRAARDRYGEGIRSIFFPDGNTIAMKTDNLCRVLDYTRELFPRLERITVYGSARFIVRKTFQEMQRLREAGLNRIHVGLESGDDTILTAIRKGATAQEMVAAGLMVKEAGMELSEYVLMGIGGPGRSREHALASAGVLNAIDPHFIRIRTFIPRPGSPLFEKCQRGEFQLVSPHGILNEIKLMIENLQVNSQVSSDHVSNYWDIRGRLPGERDLMLQEIDVALKVPEELLEQARYGGI
ncbi:MAG: radical SAM protein [Thermoanaerobacteraceae bacterium]|nr:radical SAM protein [Thermoanaerobacteraceae bacterium]